MSSTVKHATVNFHPPTLSDSLVITKIWTCSYQQTPSDVLVKGETAHYLMSWDMLAELSGTGHYLQIFVLRDPTGEPKFTFNFHANGSVANLLLEYGNHPRTQYPIKTSLTIRHLKEIAESVSTYPQIHENSNKDELSALEVLIGALRTQGFIDTVKPEENFFTKVKSACLLEGNDYFSK